MKESLRRSLIAFLLTLLLLATGTAALLAYDRMDREIGGIPDTDPGELAVGSRIFDFDLTAADGYVDTFRDGLKWIGGVPQAFFEVLFWASEWVGKQLRWSVL